jgi:hypothetical protein
VIENPINSQTNIRTVIIAKGDMLGAFGMSTTPQGTRVVTVDPRRPEPSVHVYEDADAARREFNRELAITIERGWQIVYDGQPLQG